MIVSQAIISYFNAIIALKNKLMFPGYIFGRVQDTFKINRYLKVFVSYFSKLVKSLKPGADLRFF